MDADFQPVTAPMPAGHAEIAAGWEKLESAYMRTRRMEDPEKRTPQVFCRALIASAFDAPTGPQAVEFITWITSKPVCEAGILTANIAGLLALRQYNWSAAQTLSSEVTARDHHDLLAQRIYDAASNQSPNLDTPLEAWLSDRFCSAPFEEIETRENGDVHFCCSAWQPAPIGKLTEPGEQFWNGVRAQEIRRSVLDGDFSHCSRWHCPRIADRRLPRRTHAPEKWHDVISKQKVGNAPPPARVILSHDRSCNISCPSCRRNVIMLGQAGTAQLDTLFDERLLTLVKDAKSVKVTGSGDPFASRHFRHVLRRLSDVHGPTRRLQLHTNGLLFDEKAWESLDLWDQVDSVWISIDAARRGTYDLVRRGGSFDKLLANLRFLGTMRRNGAFNTLRLDFVVQRLNYCEMGEVVELANRVGADGIYLLRLRNWGTFTPEVFRHEDVCHPEHPEHGLLLERLADPRLSGPGVEAGSLAPLIAQACASRN